MIPEAVRSAFVQYEAASLDALSRAHGAKRRNQVLSVRAKADQDIKAAIKWGDWERALSVIQSGSAAVRAAARAAGAVSRPPARRQILSGECLAVAKETGVAEGVVVALGKLLSASRASARSRLLHHTIDLPYLAAAWRAQNGKCALSQRVMDYMAVGSGSMDKPSIDRIRSEDGYLPGNIHLVCWRINKMKMDLPLNEFVLACREVAQFVAA